MTRQPALSLPRVNTESLFLASLAVALTTAVWFMVAGSIRNESFAAQGPSRDKVAKVRIPFIENQGQLATDVRYYANTFAGTVFVTSEGELVYALKRRGEEGATGWALKETFAGAQRISPRGRGQVRNRGSYIAGGDPHGSDGAPARQTVSFGEIYPGIELDLRAYGKNVEKVFVVRPGARPKNIRINVSGAQELKVNRRGELDLRTDIGSVRFDRPRAYQIRDGRKEHVEVAYSVRESSYGFAVGMHDPQRTLIIE